MSDPHINLFKTSDLFILNNRIVFSFIPNVCVNTSELTLKEARASHTLFSMNSSVILRDGCSLNTEFIKAILAALRLASAFVGQNWEQNPTKKTRNESNKQHHVPDINISFIIKSYFFLTSSSPDPLCEQEMKSDVVPGSFRSSCPRGDWRSRRTEGCSKEPSHTPPTLRSSARLLETASSARTPAEPPPRSL